MEKVKFKTLFDFQKKSKIKAGDGFKLGEAKYPFYTSSNILTKSIDEYLFEDESLIFGTGGLASIHFCNDKFAVSTDCFVTQPKDKKQVFSKFVYYYLSGNMNILESGFKGAGLKHISKDYLENIEIPLPPLATQQKIATILDQASAIVTNNRAIVAKYDALTQSLFLDMFGDPVKNEKGFELKKLEELYYSKKEGTKCGPFGGALKKEEFVDEGIPVWNMDNISKNGGFIQNINLWITNEKFNVLNSYSVINDDIIISRAGTVGKMCVVNTDFKKSIISTNLIRLRLDKNKLLPMYFVLLMNYFKDRISRLKTGSESAFTHMNTGVLNEIILPLPLITLQNQFAERVAVIESQKQQAQLELAKSEALFQSLLQRAFKGELV
jgi:type I restriction enzyme S subunit